MTLANADAAKAMAVVRSKDHFIQLATDSSLESPKALTQAMNWLQGLSYERMDVISHLETAVLYLSDGSTEPFSLMINGERYSGKALGWKLTQGLLQLDRRVDIRAYVKMAHTFQWIRDQEYYKSQLDPNGRTYDSFWTWIKEVKPSGLGTSEVSNLLALWNSFIPRLTRLGISWETFVVRANLDRSRLRNVVDLLSEPTSSQGRSKLVQLDDRAALAVITWMMSGALERVEDLRELRTSPMIAQANELMGKLEEAGLDPVQTYTEFGPDKMGPLGNHLLSGQVPTEEIPARVSQARAMTVEDLSYFTTTHHGGQVGFDSPDTPIDQGDTIAPEIERVQIELIHKGDGFYSIMIPQIVSRAFLRELERKMPIVLYLDKKRVTFFGEDLLEVGRGRKWNKHSEMM